MRGKSLTIGCIDFRLERMYNLFTVCTIQFLNSHFYLYTTIEKRVSMDTHNRIILRSFYFSAMVGNFADSSRIMADSHLNRGKHERKKRNSF